MRKFDSKENLSSTAKDWLENLGGFNPTVKVDMREIKGIMNNEKTYLNSNDLRELAAACLEVAEWLDARVDKGFIQ